MAVILYKWLMFSFLNINTIAGGLSWSSQVHKEVNHPYYVSVTQVDHNSKQKTLEISCKIFADDLEQALKQQYKTAINLSAKENGQQNDKFIQSYLQKHLSFNIDGVALLPEYIGYEKDGEAVYAYFEAAGITTIKKLSIENSILQDYTDKQINIVHATVNNKRQSTKLNHKETKAVFSF